MSISYAGSLVTVSTMVGPLTRDALRVYVSKKRHAKAWISWVNDLDEDMITSDLRHMVSKRLKHKRGPPVVPAAAARPSHFFTDMIPEDEEEACVETAHELRNDLDLARQTISDQQEILCHQAHTIRSLEAKIASMQAILTTCMDENVRLVDDAGAAEKQAREWTKEREGLVKEMAAATKLTNAHARAHAFDIAVFNQACRFLKTGGNNSNGNGNGNGNTRIRTRAIEFLNANNLLRVM